MYVSKSDAAQKIERRRADRNEQSILAEPTQWGIHAKPSKSKNFSFIMARYEGGVSTEYLPYRRCDTARDYIVHLREIFD